MSRGTACTIARELIFKRRREQYGELQECVETNVALWNAYLSEKTGPITITDFCHMMSMVKMSRDVIHENPDNLIDICGYSEIAWILRQENADEPDQQHDVDESPTCVGDEGKEGITPR